MKPAPWLPSILAAGALALFPGGVRGPAAPPADRVPAEVTSGAGDPLSRTESLRDRPAPRPAPAASRILREGPARPQPGPPAPATGSPPHPSAGRADLTGRAAEQIPTPARLPGGVRRQPGSTAALGGATAPGVRTTAALDGTALKRKP